MKILFVGKRAAPSGVSEGPVTAFESLRDGFADSGGDVDFFPDKRSSRIASYVRLLGRLWRSWDIINVHLTANFGLLIGLARPRSWHTAITVHGYSPIESVDNLYNAFMHRLQVRYLFRNRVYVSSLIQQRVEALEGVSGGVVIPNAVRPLAESGNSSQAVRDIDVLSLCGYSSTKGGAILLEAIGTISDRVSTVIAGHGGDHTKYRQWSSHSIRCQGPLTRTDIALVLARARVYVQPSLYESFGIPVVEALYAGVPTVVSTGCGVAEFLTDGVDALLVPPGDPKALAIAISRMLVEEGLAQKISEQGRITAQRFAPVAVAAQYRDYFLRLQRSNHKKGEH